MKTQDSIDKTNSLCSPLPFNTFRQFEPHATHRSSSKITKKINIFKIYIMNKNSPQAHLESELDVLGAAGKFAKYVALEKFEKEYFSSHMVPKHQTTSYWSQGILRI
jgi:hypothetical protein